eukprot:Gregarina_sp_Poly_1__161@NODE_1037_length_5285_cov_74_088540_g665_i2_p1_GENE_NODE_1037_length_5285_cov_74_088540_g665_i2NODE_1037_length_5285_cov_74_088540_g665_i2_p1_ORF_typecomplete_len1369_score276_89RabGAPTBC/PF00566_18/9_6e29Nup88/PF10168_9/0_23Nup88/PF10168_9/0_087DUF812/PF05667_11/3_8e03DUF812/PF05667_11/0_00015DUF812/PF05667_11/38KIAA1328/PF15369_6/0_0064FapA/PF03961_13/0_012FapA/PF03961_13/45AAA_23/PF13476_6/0_34AAA_23/PF13476_6/7_7FmiP_Thoc5/PF09766_9/15FmiP_Thoc5/PF09766_9/1_6UPF0242/
MAPAPTEVSLPPVPDVSLTYTQHSASPVSSTPSDSSPASADAASQCLRTLVRIPTLGIKSKSKQTSKLFNLPVKSLILVCQFLKLREFLKFISTCRHTRLLLTLDYKGSHQLGKDLVTDLLLRGGLDAHDRHRFLAQCIGWDGAFLKSISRELEIRSASINVANGRIKFLKPFESAGLSTEFSRKCSLAKTIRKSLLKNPPRSIMRNKSVFSFLLEDSSPAPSSEESGTEELHPQQKVAWDNIASEVSLNENSPTHKTECNEWCRIFELASLLADQRDGLSGELKLQKVADHHSALSDGIFEYLCDQSSVAIDESLDDEIRRDINRTLPSHLLFRLDGEAELKLALFKVLKAIAVLEPGMGYCQGMNFIVGVLLIETLCPVTSFYALLGMIRNFQFSGLYCPGLPSLKIKLRQFEELARSLVPVGFRQLLRLGLQTDLIGHQCFVTAFSYYLHASLLIKILDSFFVSGWRLFQTLGLVIFQLLEAQFERVEDAEGALKVLQTFRLSTSKVSLDTSKGRKLFTRLVTQINLLKPSVTDERLADLAVKQFIRTLRVAISQMELPQNKAAASKRAAPVLQPETSLPPSPQAEPNNLSYPFLLVPRFHDRSLWKTRQRGRVAPSWDGFHDFPAIIVNYVTLRNSRYFQIVPLEKSDPSPESADTLVPQDESPEYERSSTDPVLSGDNRVKISWCLLASQTASPSQTKSAPMTLVRGKGALPLNGFYVIIDGRQVLNGNADTRFFRYAGPSARVDSEDALSRHLFPVPKNILNETAIALTLQNGTLPEIYNITESLSFSVSCLREKKSKSNETENEDANRKYQKEASELLRWIRSHNTADLAHSRKLGAPARALGHGGFVVVPLRAIIQTKLQLDALLQQLAEDKQTFEEKISSTEKQLQVKLKEIEKLKNKKQSILEIVDQLDDEKKKLMQQLHSAVTSPKNTIQRHTLTISDGGGIGRMFSAQSSIGNRSITPELKTRSTEDARIAMRKSESNASEFASIWGRVASIFRRNAETPSPFRRPSTKDEEESSVWSDVESRADPSSRSVIKASSRENFAFQDGKLCIPKEIEDNWEEDKLRDEGKEPTASAATEENLRNSLFTANPDIREETEETVIETEVARATPLIPEEKAITISGEGSLAELESRTIHTDKQVVDDNTRDSEAPQEESELRKMAGFKSVKFDPVAAEFIFTSPSLSETDMELQDASPLELSPPTPPPGKGNHLTVVDRVVVEDGQQKTIRKLERRLKMVESIYSRNRSRLAELNKRLAILEEAAREALEIKSALVQSHYELAARQEEDELEVIRQTLKTTSDWGRDALPYQLLKIAGVVSEDSVSVALLNDIPELYSELISLPPFWPQFKSLFLLHTPQHV